MSLSQTVGVGRHGAPHRWWLPVRVLLALFTVTFVLGLVQRVPCVQTNWSSDQARYGKMCYSDIPYLYTARGFAERQWPYGDDGRTRGRYQAMEYPVGISAFAWVAAEVNGLWASGPPESVRAASAPASLWGLPGMATETNRFFFTNAVLLFCFGLLAVWFLAGTHRRRPWDALPFALSPCLLLTGLINWDLLAVAWTAGAVWAWQRGKPLWAGVFVGLGAATKLYPLFLLGAMLIVALRHRKVSWFVQAGAAAVLTWAVVNLPAWWEAPGKWEYFWTFNSARGPDLGSVWLALDATAAPHQINVVSWAAFALACVLVAILGMLASRPPRMAQLGFLIVAAFLLVNKVYSPQYVLWLLPLAVLARPRWRDLLVWQAAEVFYFVMVWLHLGGWLVATDGTETPFYALAILLRMAAEIYLMALVVRDVLRPEHDPVGGDDAVPDGLRTPAWRPGMTRRRGYAPVHP